MKRALFAALALAGCEAKISGGPGGGTAAEAAGCEPTTFELTRLNRREIDATFAEVLGDSTAPARLFAADSIAPGAFDNTASQLSLSPRLVVDLEAAGTRLIDEVWARDVALTNSSSGMPGAAQTQQGSAAQASVGQARGTAWNLWSNGEARFTFNVAAAGAHRFTLQVWGEQAGNEAARMDVWVNNSLVRSDDVPGTQGAPTTVTFEQTVPSGALTVGVRFTNDVYDEATQLDRNLLIGSVAVAPLDTSGPTTPTAQPRVVTCAPTAGAETDCARDIISRFARRAWRRAANGDELAGLVSLYDATRADGDDFVTATKLALRAVLLSPNFLLRTEAVMGADGPRAPEAVAARLSFFLWAAPPDATLDGLVDDGTLLADGVLDAQVDRMLADPRAVAVRTHLVGQWFDARDVQGFSLDPGLFQGVTPAVMTGVQRQFDAYVDEFFFRDRDALDVLDAPVTYVDAALAQFLGLPAPTSALERRELPAGDVRAGLLGQSAPLIVTSKSTETDPPRRGKWVMERLLCQPIPFPTDIEIPPAPPPTPQQPTARDRLEALTSPTGCAGCHALLNPIGFGLETYGADSRYRTEDHGARIDTSGRFRGKDFTTPGELVSIIKGDEAVELCMVKKTLSYALGRPLGDGDDPSVAQLANTFHEGRRYRALVRDVALSPLMKNGCRVVK